MQISGIIVIWSGAIVDIPTGWILCDGAGGSPDLRNRFLVGAGDTYNVDDNGGAVNHNHAFTGDGHTHDFVPGLGVNSGVLVEDTTDSTAVTGTTDNESSLPPYYALAYIMKT